MCKQSCVVASQRKKGDSTEGSGEQAGAAGGLVLTLTLGQAELALHEDQLAGLIGAAWTFLNICQSEENRAFCCGAPRNPP